MKAMLEMLSELKQMKAERDQLLLRFNKTYLPARFREDRTFPDADLHSAMVELERLIGKTAYQSYLQGGMCEQSDADQGKAPILCGESESPDADAEGLR